MKTYLAIDIGGTQIKYGRLGEEGQILERYKMDTEAHKGGPHILAMVKKLVADFHAQSPLAGVAISSAGMVDPDKGEIFYSGPQIPNYAGTQFKAEIEGDFGLPCEIENDVNCAGLAEGISGAGTGSSVSICLTIGTGIGGCLLVDGHIFHGFNNAACEVGYLHLSDGAFQDLASTTALIRYVAALHGQDQAVWDGYKIFQEAKAGSVHCIAAIDRMVDYLGQGIANVCYVANPEVVILGGGIMAQKDYLKDKIETAMKKYLVPSLADNTRLAFAQHENAAGMLGAFYHLQQKQGLR
ncbi:ROK family protein [Streptococcus ruminantium]|uniref:ROK family protein n=1 Tax=Streptococcus ruminantium TaxID=1917441 RepID=A0ABU1B2M4_9STRE|nr:ROK family protein [Streptococcus ruminantium]MDQ8759216.1 ROK family protein [Streptococcus ruminantium]MDQ8769012.1 ROK family protein [Streptococcus ruminantium]MDQ8774404.1 ROK family protein [Streptococcus ruminantium]MDQ8794329.1 ROK family protein [Streptococcus ruminantium]MDQ8795623.1 ROK family protein [Streptococcus ruminantium]